MENQSWLRRYYLLRFAVSAAWVAVAFTVGKEVPALAAIMLVAYPAWDAFANYLDAKQSGGLAANRSQQLNFFVSVAVAIGVAVALTQSMSAVIVVLGLWATLAGIFQLVTGVRRWKTAGAQWAMILSGGQSALAGTFFVKTALTAGAPVGILTIAPYAAFGAFYFFVSAVWLTVTNRGGHPSALVKGRES